MTRTPLDDFSTIDALARHLGVDGETARRVVERAGVRVIEGCFSVSSLQAALGSSLDKTSPTVSAQASESPRGRPSDDGRLVDALGRLLAPHGLRAVDAVRRRTLEITLVPMPGIDRVFYSAYDLSPDEDPEEKPDESTTASSAPPSRDDEAIEISNSLPQAARVHFVRKEHNGTLDFTVGGIEEPATPFVMFLGPRLDRTWMIDTESLKHAYDDLVRRKEDPKWKGTPPKGMHLHRTPNSLRVLLSRGPSIYELHRRLTRGAEHT